MIYSVVSKIPYDETYSTGRCIRSLRVAFNPCNPQAEWNARVAAGSALALVGATLAARYGTLGKGVALASGVVAVLLPIIRKVWVTIWPDPFWAWDEIQRISSEKCRLALQSNLSDRLGLYAYYSWPSLINSGNDLENEDFTWIDQFAVELRQHPELFELLIINWAKLEDRLLLGGIQPISSTIWKLYCHRFHLEAEIEEKGYTPQKGAELMWVSRLLTEIAFKDLTLKHNGNLEAMRQLLKSQRSPHYKYVFAWTSSYWFLRTKVSYEDLSPWRAAYNKMCEEVAPLWENMDDKRFRNWHPQDKSKDSKPPNDTQPT